MRRLLVVIAAAWAVFLFPRPADAQTTAAIRAAAMRALPRIERSVSTFVSKRSCVSCHHNSVAILTLRSAIAHGIPVTTAVRQAVEAKSFDGLTRESAFDDAVQGTNASDPTPNDSYLLMAAHAAGVVPDATLAVHARRIARWQREGHWTTSDFRPPHSSSLFTATATAVRAVTAYFPPEAPAERDVIVARAREWLVRAEPRSTEDAAFRVMGLVWAGASSGDVGEASRDLLARQLIGGGWPQRPGYAPDAYSTGEALVALREAGTPVTDTAWRRGLRFLLRTQAADGTWRVRTRMVSPAQVSPPYFATGFGYGKDEFLSFTGSCWAFMALASALPDVPGGAASSRELAGSVAPSWARVALFGTAAELASALDSGLEPNRATAGGTTLLMLVAHDAEKTRLVLSRGAAASARSRTSADALTVATTYLGSSASVAALLGAGASPTAPADVRVRRSPLVWAAMTGDVDVVRQLLASGAMATTEVVSEAVTFDRPNVLRALIDVKADVSGTESSGITLLHWATITNRPRAIPMLVEAGLSPDDADENGYTPLMFAASIDFGDEAVLQALLAAGANQRLRNVKGRTARELALRHGHRDLARALKAP